MCSVKTPQTGPSSLVLATFHRFDHCFQGQYGKVKLQGMRRSTDPVAQHAVHDATMMQSWPNITIKNKHYHASSCHTRANPSTHWLLRRATLFRHFVVLSQRQSDFGAWDAQGQWKVILCNSAASEASARSLSLQATRCCRYCRYIDSSARFDH